MSDTATSPSSAVTQDPIQPNNLGVMAGKDAGIYALMILVWGTSWIAMANQIDIVPALITGIYRFSLAASLMFLWAFLGKYPMRFPLKVHVRFALLGIFIFSSNFVMFYFAASYMASGLMAVIFSLASLINIAMSAIFLGQRPSMIGLVGAALGFGGIGLIFWPEIATNVGSENSLLGLACGFAGTLCFCTGNMISISNRKQGIPLVSANAWGMLYGTVWMLFLALILDVPFVMDWSAKYWIAMAWLVVMASVVAFWGYMTLLSNIGPARAGYLTVLFPIVALMLSSIFEDYRWTIPGMFGLAAIVAGNILVMRKK